MSNQIEACEQAHLVPVEEEEWFSTNEMEAYTSHSGNRDLWFIDDVNNRLLLRSDLHKFFDDQMPPFIPKRSSTSNATSFVTHMLLPSEPLAVWFQNTRLLPIDSIPRKYLFARLA